MSTTAEKKAIDDGYNFSGVWCRKWETDILKTRQDKLKAEGYKTRRVAKNGGVSIYTKDTLKTLKSKQAAEIKAEEKRREVVRDVTQLMLRVISEADAMKMNQLTNIRYEVKKILERGW